MNENVGFVNWIKFSIFYWSEIQNLKRPHHLVIFASIYSVTCLSWTSLPDTYFRTKISWKKLWLRNLGHFWRLPTVILFIPLVEDVGRSLQSKSSMLECRQLNQPDEAPYMSHQIIVNSTSCPSEDVCGICFAHTCFLKRSYLER